MQWIFFIFRTFYANTWDNKKYEQDKCNNAQKMNNMFNNSKYAFYERRNWLVVYTFHTSIFSDLV